MYKIFLLLLFSIVLNAKIIDSVAIVVQHQPITTLDIAQTMQKDGISRKKAINLLIRQKLEAIEIKQRDITVTYQEVLQEIKRIAKLNHMNVEQFYTALQNSDDLTPKQIQKKTKKRLLNQKLFQAIAFAHMYKPSKQEIKNYFELHKREFEPPSSYVVIIYSSTIKALLQRKVTNPMFYSPRISSENKTFITSKIAPGLATILASTKLNRFSKIIPNNKLGYISFYLKQKGKPIKVTLLNIKAQIKNKLMMQKREEVLSEYFKRLRLNIDITILKLPL